MNYHTSYFRAMLTVLVALWISASAQANSADHPSNSSLEHWITISRENNPALQSTYHQWRSKQAMSQAAGSLPDPTLTFDYFIDEVQTRTGPQQSRLMLAQKLPWFGKRELDAAIAGSAANLAEQDLVQTQLQLTQQLTHLWADGVYVEVDTLLTRENLALLEQIERIARTRYRLARTSHPDLIRIQLQRSKVENQVTNLQTRRLGLASRLAAISRQPVSSTFSWPVSFPSLAALASEQALQERLQGHNPGLQKLRFQNEMRHSQIKQAELQGRPDITVRYGRIFTGAAVMPGTEGSGEDPQYVGVGINIPLWVSKIQHLENAAHQAKMESEFQLTAAALNLENELNSALYKLQNAEQQLVRYQQELIPQAENVLTTLIKAYQTGNSDFSDLLETEKLLLDLKREQANLKRNRWKAHADVMALIGKTDG